MNADSLSFPYAGLARSLSSPRSFVRERKDDQREQSRRRRKDPHSLPELEEGKRHTPTDTAPGLPPDPEAALQALSRRPDLARNLHRPDDRKVAGALNRDENSTASAETSQNNAGTR